MEVAIVSIFAMLVIVGYVLWKILDILEMVSERLDELDKTDA